MKQQEKPFFISVQKLTPNPMGGPRIRTRLTINRADVTTVEDLGLIETDASGCAIKLRNGDYHVVVGKYDDIWNELHSDQKN